MAPSNSPIALRRKEFGGLFGFYDANQEIVPVHHQTFFVLDTIGLKPLNDSDKLMLEFNHLNPISNPKTPDRPRSATPIKLNL